MIKWFCDVCGEEIPEPENPVSVKAYRSGKSRLDAELGWGEPHDIIRAFCHKKCADALETELRSAFFNAKNIVGKEKP
jgi:hypothetical protein